MKNIIKSVVALLACALANQGLWMLFAPNPMTISPILLLIGFFSLLMGVYLAFLLAAGLVGMGSAYLFFGYDKKEGHHWGHLLVAAFVCVTWAFSIIIAHGAPAGSSDAAFGQMAVGTCSALAGLGYLRKLASIRKPA